MLIHQVAHALHDGETGDDRRIAASLCASALKDRSLVEPLMRATKVMGLGKSGVTPRPRD